jgi:hypothetical protein
MVAPNIGTEEVMPDECLVSKKGGKDKPEEMNVFMGPRGSCSAEDELRPTLNRINRPLFSSNPECPPVTP